MKMKGPYKNLRYTGGRSPIMEKITMWMSDSGKTKAELHEETNVSMTTMYNWEKKTKSPKFDTIASVALACGKSEISLKTNR